MKKNDMHDDKKTIPLIHHLPQTDMPEFHRKYGLWIFYHATGTTCPNCYDSCSLRYFEFYSLSHMYDGKGRLYLENGKTTEIASGDCVLITPRTRNRYGSIDGFCYTEDVVNFTGPVADMLLHSGIIADGVYSLGHFRRLLPIMKYASDPAVDAQLQANIELQKLLAELYLKKNSIVKPQYPLLEELLDEIREHPERWWNICDMAEYCNLCKDQFRRIFFRRTGVKPKVYIERLKINRAAEYFSASGSSIAETASHFGYQDQYHFARRFKTVMGVSPGQYRDNMANLYHGETSDTTDKHR